MGKPLDDLVNVFRRVFRAFRLIGFVFLGVTLWVIGREIVALHGAVREVSPVLGVLFLVAAVALVGRLLGVPVWRFLKMPAVVRPPETPVADADWRVEHSEAHVEYLGRYLASVARNPRLRGARTEIQAAVRELDAVRARVVQTGDAGKARADVASFETRFISPILAPLDREVDVLIRNEALGVGIATAISPNGTLDAFLVLWRNANLVSRIANVYYGRPGARGTLTILRDVSAAALLATYLEGVSEAAAGVLRGVLGSVAGVVAGPVVDGSINAVATLRIGYLAKARCRSFKAWNEATRREALKAALVAAKDRSKDVLAGIAKAAGGTFADLSGKVGGAVKDGLGGLWKRLTGDAGESPQAE